MRAVGQRFPSRGSIESTLGNHGLSLTLGISLIAANVLLFIWGAHDEAAHHTDYKRWVMSIARGAGYALNFDAGLVLLLGCRAAVGAARSSRLSAVVPLDALFPTAHAAVGVAIGGFVVVHAVFHLGWIFKDDAWGGGVWGITWCVCSGVVLTAVLLVLLVTASRQFRRAKYHFFYRVHLVCAVAFYPLLVVHGVYYGSPYTYKWIVGPMIVYALDRGYRLVTQCSLSTAATLTPLPGGVVRVNVPRGAATGPSATADDGNGGRHFPYEAGAYAKVRVMDINSQWHPFTIASAPHEPDLVLYVKTGAGDWTGALGEMAARDGGAPVPVAIDVKGPYGALHMTRFTHVLLIAGGVGGTPFVSLVKDVHHRMAGAAGGGGVDGQPLVTRKHHATAVGEVTGGPSSRAGDLAGRPAGINDIDDAQLVGPDTTEEDRRRALRVTRIRTTLSRQVTAALSACTEDSSQASLQSSRRRATPRSDAQGGTDGTEPGVVDGEHPLRGGRHEEDHDCREHDAEAHLGGAAADAAVAAAAAAASTATADALVSPPRQPRGRGGSSSPDTDACVSPCKHTFCAWGGGGSGGGGGGGGRGGRGGSTGRASGGRRPGGDTPGSPGTVTSWGEDADEALEGDSSDDPDGDEDARAERVAQLSHALFSPPWRGGDASWSASAGLALAGWREPEVVVHSPLARGGGRDEAPLSAVAAAEAGAMSGSVQSTAAVVSASGGTVPAVASPHGSRRPSSVAGATACGGAADGGDQGPLSAHEWGQMASPRRPPPAMVHSPRRTLERIGVSFGRSPTAAAAAAATDAAAVSAGRVGGRRRQRQPAVARTPRLCASPADGDVGGSGAGGRRGGGAGSPTFSPVGSSSTTSPLSATNVLDSPLGGRADAPTPALQGGGDGGNASAEEMAAAMAVPPQVRRPPPKFRAMLALDTVTVNFVLLWLLMARFCVALLACIFRVMAPMDGSAMAPGIIASSAAALYDHASLVVADLVLALAVALPVSVAVALEAHELGLEGLSSSVGAVVDAILLLPLAWLGIVIDAAALAGVPSAVSTVSFDDGSGGVLIGAVGTARPWLFVLTFGLAWPALAVLLGLRLFRVLGARVLLAQSWRRSDAPTRALDFVWTTPAAAGDEWLRDEMGGLLGSPHVRMHRFVTRSGREADVAALAAEQKRAAAAATGRRAVAPVVAAAPAVGSSAVDVAAIEAVAPTGDPPTPNDGGIPGVSPDEVPATTAAAAVAAPPAVAAPSPPPSAAAATLPPSPAAGAAGPPDWTVASHYGRPDWSALLRSIAERATSRTVLGIFFCGPAPMAEAVRRAASRAMCESRVRGLVLAGLLYDGRLEGVDRATLRGVTATGLDVRFVMHVETF